MSVHTRHDLAEQTEAALRAWRVRAADAVLLMVAVATIPPTVVWFLGYKLPHHRVPIVVFVVLMVIASAVARRWSPVVRVWLVLSVLYVAAVHGLIWYAGTMARVWLVGTPILALILAGRRSARVAALISIGVITLHAVLAAVGIAAAWQVPGSEDIGPRMTVAQAIMWLAFFIPLLFLLQRHHRLHVRTLANREEAMARLEEETLERRAASESLAQSAAERERLEHELARVSDAERRRLGHDLHDGASQRLAGALLRCTVLEDRLATEGHPAAADAQALGSLLEAAIGDVQEIARSLSTLDMAPEALGPALHALARRAGESFGICCECRDGDGARLPDRERTLHLYRIAQEAVNNAGKHAHARRIAVSLTRTDGGVRLVVEDDGCGMPTPPPGRGLGLRIMAFRAQRLGGSLEIERPPDGGTRVVCTVPTGGPGDA